MKLLKKITNYIQKKRKNKPLFWLQRWDTANLKLWMKFSQNPATKENLEWMSRNHQRLMKLARNKNWR